MLKPYQRLSRYYDAGWGDFAVRYLGLIDGLFEGRGITRARICDIACGTGLLNVELARRGHIVHGLDISPNMIREARRKGKGIPNLSFEVRDMLDFESDSEYAMVTCTFDSINYIRRLSDLRKLFFRVAAALNEKGLFLFDSNTRHLYISHGKEVFQQEIHGESFVQECGYRSRINAAVTTFAFSDGTSEIHFQRPYSYEELSPLLEKAGFQVRGLYSWFEKIPYTPGAGKFFCVAEKFR